MKRILIAGESDKTFNYEDAVRALGACPVTALHLPSTSGYDGLILPGGGDIDPRLFGQLAEGTRAFDPALDRIQMAILRAFAQAKKPGRGS